MELPQSFAVQMKQELGGEWDAFLTACQEKPCRGYRLNHAKMTQIDRQNNRTADPETAGTETPDARVAGILSGESVAWCASGRYLREESGKETYPISKHPLHYAGAYYIQEPSAMLPAAMLHACPGDRVLDLCAAPGGKSTQLIDDMEDCGLLISNDISASRGKAIVRNLERFGKARILVTAEEPEKLARVFPEYFDKILVDAPCSGEGMFRREPSMREEWLKKGPDFYAPIQREILSQAVKMLRPGGRIVYSTCTFCKQEDEENVAWLLNEYPEFTLVEDKKLMPHRCKGEGQYAALMEKAADGTADRSACGLTDCLMSDWAELTGGSKLTNRKAKKPIGNFKEKGNEAVLDFFRLTGMNWDTDRWYERDGQLYELPVDIGPMKSLRFLRTGLWPGEIKKGRFEPSQALAMYLKKDQFANTVDFAWEDERVVRYLKGETIEAEGAVHLGKDGWCLVLAGGLPLGWAKRSGETLKNKYEPGLANAMRDEKMTIREEILRDKKAVLFDMDGTLVDSMWIWRSIDMDFLGARGLPMPENLQADIEGMSFSETAHYFKKTFGLQESEEEIKMVWNRMAFEKYRTQVLLKPGAWEFLEWLKARGFATAICTSNSRELIDMAVKARGIENQIDYVVTACEVNAGKPAPDIYLHAADVLQAAPKECVVFEDIPAGILAGKRAGMTVCAVEDEYSDYCIDEKKKLSDFCIRDFTELVP